MISLKSNITRELLGYFFLHEEEALYVNEMVRRLGIDKRNLLKKLGEFTEAGLFKTEARGNLKYYALNRTFPLYNEYKRIVLKTAGIEFQLRESLRSIKGIKRAFIYGSYARDKMDTASDIDIIVIGNHRVVEVQKAIGIIQKKCEREINAINLGDDEFKAKKRDPFISDVMKKEKIELL